MFKKISLRCLNLLLFLIVKYIVLSSYVTFYLDLFLSIFQIRFSRYLIDRYFLDFYYFLCLKNKILFSFSVCSITEKKFSVAYNTHKIDLQHNTYFRRQLEHDSIQKFKESHLSPNQTKKIRRRSRALNSDLKKYKPRYLC